MPSCQRKAWMMTTMMMMKLNRCKQRQELVVSYFHGLITPSLSNNRRFRQRYINWLITLVGAGQWMDGGW